MAGTMWPSKLMARAKANLIGAAKSILIQTIPRTFFDLQMKSKMHEPEVALLPQLLVARGVAVDVGANEGLWVYHMQKRASLVIAFEPVNLLADQLERKAGKNVRVERFALSSAPGVAQLRYPRRQRAWGTIEAVNQLQRTDREVVTQQVTTLTLDSFALEWVDLVKIDVEGHELAVLEGACETLERCHPNLIIEIEDAHNPGALSRIRALLEGIGYSGYFFDGTLRPIADFDQARDQRAESVGAHGKTGRYINNFIFKS